MKLRYVELGEFDRETAQRLSSWTEKLAGCKVDYSHSDLPKNLKWNAALRVIWLGDPFVLAGGHNLFTKYFDDMDSDTARLFKDCAYFWLLSDSIEYTHPRLPRSRIVVLDWTSSGQRKIRDAIERLSSFPRLKGLSESADLLRKEIRRVAEEPTGPGCSVLIAGPSGSGKEEVAHSLVEGSSRAAEGMQALGGAWLKMEPGMALTELVGLRRGPIEERCDGLLKQLTKRAMFIDDFESAPPYIQETLLRIMAVAEGEEAAYRPVGADGDEHTNVWPIFATNKNLQDFMKEGLRADFLYRFGARIISILPLSERPADLPAIAHGVWKSIWDKTPDDARREPLRSDALRCLFAKDVDWGGNVRSLASLLKLVVAGMRDPALNGYSQTEIVEMITARGRTYFDMVIGQQERKLMAVSRRLEDEIREADNDHPRRMGPSAKNDPDEAKLTRSEEAAKAALTTSGWTSFCEIVRSAPPTKSRKVVRVSVRLARIIWYLSERKTISVEDAAEITGIAGGSEEEEQVEKKKNQTTARKDLEYMSHGQKPINRMVRDSSKAHHYELVSSHWRVDHPQQV
jgi:DNA-binding NtrC family response regulator